MSNNLLSLVYFSVFGLEILFPRRYVSTVFHRFGLCVHEPAGIFLLWMFDVARVLKGLITQNM